MNSHSEERLPWGLAGLRKGIPAFVWLPDTLDVEVSTVPAMHTLIMWPADPPEKRATERPLTSSRALLAGGILTLGRLGLYLLTIFHLVRPSDGLFFAVVLGVFGVFLLGYSLYRLTRFGRFDSGYDASVDGPLEEKLQDDEDASS